MPDPQPHPARPVADVDPSSTDAHLVAESGEGTGDRSLVGGTPVFGPPTEPGEVGTLGPYRIVKELGRGGMGAVYLALDPRLNRKLALKVMLPRFAAHSAAKERFLREARAAGQISHDNVVPVFEADERDGIPYIAMPFLRGYPLDDYLRKKGNLTPEQVIRVGLETAAGLAAAHDLGLIHRDIKPANLWLEAPGGRIKILDFGLARPIDAASEVTRNGAVVGTPAFMAPEQAAGEKLDHRADLFSLGAVLYRLAAGRNPFAGANVMATLTALATRDPIPVRSLNPNIPDALAGLIHQLLAKDPAARPQTAKEVAAAFAAMAHALAAGELSMCDAVPVATVVPEVVYVPIAVSMTPEHSAFADIDADNSAERARAVVAHPQLQKPSRVGPWAAVGLAVAVAAVLVAVVIVKITGRDGKEAPIEVPDGSTVKIEPKGKIDVAPPKEKNPPPKKGDGSPEKGAATASIDLLMRDATPWTVLESIEMKSEGGATLTRQDDGSILVSGTLPDRDVYTLTFRGLPASIQGLRLEVLPHDSLPQKGPGRAGDGGFVLTEIKAQFDPLAKTGEPRVLMLGEARADFSKGADSREHLAIDGNDDTGWATETGKPHFCVFRLAESVAVTDVTALRVTLEFRHGNRQHVLGCFRLSVSGGANPPAYVPPVFDEKEAKKQQENWATKLKAPVEAENKIGMKMVLIPPAGAALPSAYYLGKYEVTQGEWEKVMGYNPSRFGPKHPKVAGMDTSRFPVDSVSWYDSVEFSNKLSAREGLKPYYELTVKKRTGPTIEDAVVTILGGDGYRLPTAAEWEHGCRAGAKTKYHSGDSDDDLLEYAWVEKNSEGRTHAVGEKKPNAFGLHDTHGNVWEWNEEVIFRGGPWNNPAESGKASFRGSNNEAQAFRSHNTGLRLARSPSLPPTLNSIGMEFVIVPKGKSWLGGGGGEPGDREVEIPADFYLGKYEVTQEQWTRVMGTNPGRFSRTGDGRDAVKGVSDADLQQFPVERVSWEDCQLFIKKLNELEKGAGWIYRLPTAVEWEYACRGGPLSDKADSAFDYYFTKPTNTLLPEQANFDRKLNRTCKVGSYLPNRLGLFDMHGNVWEWCDDPDKTIDGVSTRVYLGGSYTDVIANTRSALRRTNLVASIVRFAQDPTYRFNNLGLRLARVPVAQGAK